MRKLMSAMLVAGAAAASAPAALADDRPGERRENVRNACPEDERCQGSSRVLPWFYLGSDEDAQTRRRVVRRLSLDS